MINSEIKYFKKYSASVYLADYMQRFLWRRADLRAISKSEMDKFDEDLVSLIPEGVRLLEVGCGNGRLAEKIINTVNIASYEGFDLVEKNVEDARKRIDLNFYRANLWDVLSQDGDWDFILSQGTLFTCTEPDHRNLLLELIHNTAARGFVCAAVVFRKPKVSKLKDIVDRSIGVKDFDFGSRIKLPPKLFNSIFWVVRDGIKEKRVPEIPCELKGLPECSLFEEMFD